VIGSTVPGPAVRRHYQRYRRANHQAIRERLAPLSALTVNNMHNLEHYGNLATYMRIKKNIVPPSSN